MMYVLIKGDLETGERWVVGGPRVNPYRAEADALNLDHWNFWRKQLAPFLRPKRYIWFTEETPQ